MRAKLWLTLAGGLVLASGAAGEWQLLKALVPNPFLVGLLGLLLGATIAALIGLWWPKKN
ncbi:hypothetical protein ACFQ3L_02010 [Lacticaseibacillus jixianensis]|uniref:Uncharacterized protein n=1 Tax=Lacticaseibacillus jixianensis TaxID=2486012 RepID=A0ABW4B5R1_9LACO|nr:hypothetical protein [Lacticaseibacillus jixianensis]